MALLEVQHVYGGYTNRNVLEDVSFTVDRNEVVGLIGLNGAGKSTTIKHIIGLMDREKERLRSTEKRLPTIRSHTAPSLHTYRKHRFYMTN